MSKKETQRTYLLVHGAWHASWCWQKISTVLQAQGHRVIAPDLPGHGTDRTPLAQICLQTYVDCVRGLVLAQKQSVILVGHSMAGIIISQVAEEIPDKIERLVYLTAFAPKHRCSLLHVAKNMSSNQTPKHIHTDQAKHAMTLQKSAELCALFFNCCTETDALMAMSLLEAEPYLPFTEPVKLSAKNFGRVKKTYIECAHDKVIPLSDQKNMHAHLDCEVITISADHAPFFSAVNAVAVALIK